MKTQTSPAEITTLKTAKPKSLMKRLATLTAVLGLAAGGAGVASASSPVLFNGNLNQVGAAGANGQANPGPVGWQITASQTFNPTFSDGADSETFCNGAADPNPSGD